MDKLSSLRAFVKVVELSSFSEAGRQFRLSRSAISKYVSDLEQELGGEPGLLNGERQKPGAVILDAGEAHSLRSSFRRRPISLR
jgi:Bacterial regulatory helix-turn-helix protein, lysR family